MDALLQRCRAGIGLAVVAGSLVGLAPPHDPTYVFLAALVAFMVGFLPKHS